MLLQDFKFEANYNEDKEQWEFLIKRGDKFEAISIDDHLWDDQETFIRLLLTKGIQSAITLTNEEENETSY